MPVPGQLKALRTALEELLSSPGSPEVGASLRRLAWAVVREEDNPSELREAAERLMIESGPALEEAARSLLEVVQDLVGDDGDEIRPGSGHAFVLVANGDTSSTVSRILGRAGWRVTVRDVGKGVLASLADDPADLLVIDIFLRDCDGRDVIVDLSQAEATEDVPMIAVAPAFQREVLTESECLALGADRFLPRSAVAGRLEAVVRDLTGGVTPEARAADAPDPVRILSKGRFMGRYRSAERRDACGSLALIQFREARSLLQLHGAEHMDRITRDVATALAELTPGVREIGRWSALQFVACLPEDPVDAAARHLEAAMRQVTERSWPPEAETVIARMEVSVVEGPDGPEVERQVTLASELRVGLADDGVVLRAGGQAAPDRVPRIAVVEDDPVTRTLVVYKLEQSGLDVVPFEDGNRATEAFHEDGFDLFVLDINLPGRSGFDLIRQLREQDLTRAAPILVLSGMGSDADVVRGLDLGADDYMLKPFSPVELTARVRRLLGALVD